MTSEQTKQLVEATEKDFQEKKQEKVKELIKEIVSEYLRKIDNLDTEIDELQEEKKQLKLTLDDIKAGKLDVLKERLEKDPRARKINVIKICETHIHNHPSNPFYTPWVIQYTPPIIPHLQPIYSKGAGNIRNAVNTAGFATSGGNTIDVSFTTTGSECKGYAVGTYNVNSSVVNFR